MHWGTSACIPVGTVSTVRARRRLLRCVWSEPRCTVDVVSPDSVELVLVVVVVEVVAGGGGVAGCGC